MKEVHSCLKWVLGSRSTRTMGAYLENLKQWQNALLPYCPKWNCFSPCLGGSPKYADESASVARTKITCGREVSFYHHYDSKSKWNMCKIDRISPRISMTAKKSVKPTDCCYHLCIDCPRANDGLISLWNMLFPSQSELSINHSLTDI